MGASTLLWSWLLASMHDLSTGHSGYVGIVNGTIAKPHSRPYMVSVQKNMQHWCGGFLISKSFVMTAAHCVTWGVNLTVVVGTQDITNKNNGIRIPVKFYHINPGYKLLVHNDIALLQLDKVEQRAKSVVDWISLPKKDKDIKANSKCSVVGWGKMTTKGNTSNLLLQADVSILKREVCEKGWRSNFTSNMLCAGGKGGFCQGDSGGPLVCKKEAVGIVSFNEDGNCDKPTVPNVYTKISSFLPWIKSILKSVKH